MDLNHLLTLNNSLNLQNHKFLNDSKTADLVSIKSKLNFIDELYLK